MPYLINAFIFYPQVEICNLNQIYTTTYSRGFS